ncbi:MAG: hypothetical protein J6V36_01565 [Clostridia bacterium]|nr:hypothetical protein [Clostridia bacterium]
MNKNTKKLVIGAGALGFGFSAIAAATYMLTGTLVKVALERNGIDKFKQTPKTRKIISGMDENKEFMDLRSADAEKLSSLPSE